MSHEAFSYTDPGTPSWYKCATCGATGCKLWREYSMFGVHLLCLVHVETEQTEPRNTRRAGNKLDAIGWRVAAVPDEVGRGYWGYTSIPDEGLAWWYALPTVGTHSAWQREREAIRAALNYALTKRGHAFDWDAWEPLALTAMAAEDIPGELEREQNHNAMLRRTVDELRQENEKLRSPAARRTWLDEQVAKRTAEDEKLLDAAPLGCRVGDTWASKATGTVKRVYGVMALWGGSRITNWALDLEDGDGDPDSCSRWRASELRRLGWVPCGEVIEAEGPEKE